MTITICTSIRPIYSSYFDHDNTVCLKPVDEQGRHRGDHFGWENMPAIKAGAHTLLGRPMPEEDIPPWTRLWTWSQGGSAGSSRHPHAPAYCSVCATPYFDGDCSGHPRSTPCQLDGQTAGRCSHCRIWMRRIEEVNTGKWRYLRPHPGQGMSADRAYSFSPKNPGGFGGMRVTITMDAEHGGEVIASNQAGLWDAGHIPWEFEEYLPPNCSFVTGLKDHVPGYTTGSGGKGQPLTYTGDPAGPETTKVLRASDFSPEFRAKMVRSYPVIAKMPVAQSYGASGEEMDRAFTRILHSENLRRTCELEWESHQ